ncbi:Chorion peroxidase [Anthophora quadrimaculata]
MVHSGLPASSQEEICAEVLEVNTNDFSGSENVGGLHELQRRELWRQRASVRHDFRRWDRKRVLRVRKRLPYHQKGAGTRESVVRVWQGDRELASTRESCQTLNTLLLVLLSSTLSKSTTDHERLETSNIIKSKNVSTNDDRTGGKDKSTEPIETLFIPEDPSEYEEILHYVRKIFGGVERSTSNLTNQQEDFKYLEKNVADNRTREDQFSKLETLEERNSSFREGEENEEVYLQRNPGGEDYRRTNAEVNKKDEVVLMERNNYDGVYKEKNEPDEEDLLEAVNFGLNAMKDLYTVKEPMLYSMGLYLDFDNPARHVALFNDQTEEARTLAKYGFAILQGTTMFKRKFPDASTDSLLSRQSQSNPFERSCPNRGVPDCPRASLRYRTSDGSCNNLQQLWWGSAMSSMQRFLPPAYDDGIQSIRKSVTGRTLPSPRRVTTAIHTDRDIPLASVTHMLMQWGQFVDHDLTATGQSRGFNGTIPQCCLQFGAGFQPPEFMHPECLPIPVSGQDGFFGPLGVKCLEFVRSGPAPREDCTFGPREQLSQVTSYLDASTVYSSNAFQTDALRLFRNGLLQYGRLQSQRPLLPKHDSDICKRGSLSTSCFRAGDGRLGEQPALTSLHVAFLRLHNRIATKLAAINSHWSDEKLFQESRRIVGAIVQHITYREFLPIVLGQDVMKIFDLELMRKGYYEGYDPTVNPTIANAFSTAAYRFGHSLVQHSFVRFDRHHQPIFNNVSIHNEFTNPSNLETAGSVDRLLLGLINQPAQRRDEHISDELTNHLFQTPSFPFGMDLASINIQRGRDHGIPPYVKWREPCGLSPVRNFHDLEKTMPQSSVQKFKLVYSSVEDIDLFSAGLAELSVKGGLVGPTFACIIGQQFNHLRKGDRFWYENSQQEGSFTPGQLQQIRRVTLAQVLCTTMDTIETIQPFVFLTQDTLKNERLLCNDSIIGQLNLKFWAERSDEFKSRTGIFSKFKEKTTQATPVTKETVSQKQTAAGSNERIFPLHSNPPKTSIHQQNRIVVKKPLGPSDNVTIIVQNNAINSPVIIRDGVHGSSIRVDPSLNQQTQEKPVSHEPLPIPIVHPPVRPIPTIHPLVNLYLGHPYVPYAYDDPSNPNPPSQFFRPGYGSSDVVFDGSPGTSPRPTLYTYYTNFHKPSTQRPANYESINPSYVVSNNQQYSNEKYGTNTWQKVQSEQSSSQGYWQKPFIDTANKLYDRDKYTTLSSVYIDKKEQTKPGNLINFDKPTYQVITQLNERPIQNNQDTWSSAVSSYHDELVKTNIDRTQNYQTLTTDKPAMTIVNIPLSSPYGKPIIDDGFKSNPSGSYAQKYQDNAFPIQQDYQIDKLEYSYHSVARPKPSRLHSVAIATESTKETTNEAGYEHVETENQVTDEIPRPLIDQTSNNRVGKPGQYYYEKNVLHRYPDKTEYVKEMYNGEQRHKVSIDRPVINASARDQIIGGNGSDTTNRTKNDSSGSMVGVNVTQDFDHVSTQQTEADTSGTRTSHWLNPQEDSSLSSAMEVPNVPMERGLSAKELPKPIKFRNYAS